MTAIAIASRAAVFLAAALTLAGCGRRGALEPPPGAADAGAPPTGVPDVVALPRNSEIAPIDSASVSAPSAANPDRAAAPGTPPPARAPKSFPLDPLL